VVIIKELDVIDKFLTFISNKGFTKKNYTSLTYEYALSLHDRVPGRKRKKETEEFAKDWMIGAGCEGFITFTETINEVREILDQLTVPFEIKTPAKRIGRKPPGEVIERINIGVKDIPHPTLVRAFEMKREGGEVKKYPDHSRLYRVTTPTSFRDYLFYPISLMMEERWEECAWLRKCSYCGGYFIDRTRNHTKTFCKDKCRVYHNRKPVTAKA